MGHDELTPVETPHGSSDHESSVVHDGDDATLGSLGTDDASVTNSPTSDNDALRWQEGVEVGGVTADGVDNSGGDNGWGQGQITVVSETFSNAFNSVPEIGISEDANRDSVSNTEYKANMNNPSTTGFAVQFRQMSADDESGTTDAYAVSYVASEGR
jgi:hypothetical protein